MTPKTPEEFHNRLGFIFHAILAVPLGSFVFLFLEIKNRGFEPALANGKNATITIGVLLIVAIAMLVWGYRNYQKQLANINSDQPLQDKLSEYFRVALTFYILLELASLMMVLGLYLTTSTFFIVGYMFLLLVLSLNRPTPQKYVKDLQLQADEQDIILHKKPFNSGD